jgi:hypothetical protein
MYALSTRSPVTDVELARLHRRLRQSWPGLPQPLVIPWSESPVLTLDRGTPWLYGPVERIPLHGRTGHTVVPRRQRAKLKAIASRGRLFQRVAVADELDPRGPVHNLLPALRRGPITCTDDLTCRLVRPVPAHPGTSRAVRALGRLVGSATSTAGRGVERLLDPIVFGVAATPALREGEPSLWFPLVAWRW